VVARTDTLAVDLSGIFQLTVIDSSNLCRKSDVIEVFDSLNPPFIEIAEPDIITCLNNQVMLNTTIDVVEGTFEWNILSETGNIVGAANSPNLLVDSAGTYQIEVTNDFSGCQGARNITVLDVRQAIEIEAGTDKTLTCFNDTTVVAAGTIFTLAENLRFSWTANLIDFVPIDTSLIFTIDRTGTYFLSVVDTISFCEVVDSFEVDKNIEGVDASIGETLTLDCSADSIILGDLNDFGQQDYLYSWTTEDGAIVSGTNEPMAVATSGGLYQLFIQNNLNGCSAVDTQRVVENRLLPAVDVGNITVITCTNEEIMIGGENTSIGENFIYEWTTEAGNILEGVSTPFALINAAGTYQLSVLDTTNQCQNNQSTIITDDKLFPDVNLPSGLDIDCMDEFVAITPSIQLPENRVAVEWSTNNGLLLSDTETFTAQAGMPGLYFLVLTDTANSCVTIDSVEIFDNRQLPEVASLQNQMLGCDDATITIDADGSAFGEDISYEWQNEAGRVLSNNTTLMISIPGNYVLLVTDGANNCVNTDTVLITENTNPPTSAFFDIESPSCNDTEDGIIEVLEVVGGTAPYQYSIEEDTPELTTVFSDLAPNTYLLSITDNLACRWDTTIILSQPEMIQASIEVSDDNLETGELAIFNVLTSIPDEDIVSIEWLPINLFDCFNCDEVSASFLNNTTVEVIITDINDCEGFASIDIEVALAATPNAITPNGDGSNDFFIVPQIEREPDAFPDSELIIFNRWGDVLFQISPYDNNWDGRNNKGESLVEGTYYYVLRLDTREGEVIKGDVTIIRR